MKTLTQAERLTKALSLGIISQEEYDAKLAELASDDLGITEGEPLEA